MARRHVTVSRTGLKRLENIQPPMRNAITIPIWVDGNELIVYVCRGAFTPQLVNEGHFVKDVATHIVTAIEDHFGEN